MNKTDRAKLTANLTPVKAKMALRFKSTDVNMALLSIYSICLYQKLVSTFFSTISGLPFHSENFIQGKNQGEIQSGKFKEFFYQCLEY